jgi:peroxiredoxin
MSVRSLLAIVGLLGMQSTSLAIENPSLDAEIQTSTLIHQGEPPPDFSCQTTDGITFTLSQQKGKVVLLYFFASSVPFCYAEMRYIEKEIVKKLEKRTDFVVLCLARGHTREEVVRIAGENHLRLPMAADESREIYASMFTKFVPRTVLVSQDGRVIYTSAGSREFEGIVKLQQVIARHLRDSK